MSVVRVQLRGDTAANWTSANPVLAAREFALETDTSKYKIGDGTTAWNSLAYSSLPSTALASGGPLGTPSSGTLTNTTGLPISTGVSGLGSGVATFLATPSSANLASAVTDETGTGALVFGTAPAITSGNFVASTETINLVASAATGTINFDALTASVWHYTTNATGNATLNFRGSSSVSMNTLLATGQSITLAWIQTNGATAYYPTTFQVDGSAVTPKWATGTAPTAGNASANDVYTFTIVKTASATYTVYASVTKFA